MTVGPYRLSDVVCKGNSGESGGGGDEAQHGGKMTELIRRNNSNKYGKKSRCLDLIETGRGAALTESHRDVITLGPVLGPYRFMGTVSCL